MVIVFLTRLTGFGRRLSDITSCWSMLCFCLLAFGSVWKLKFARLGPHLFCICVFWLLSSAANKLGNIFYTILQLPLFPRRKTFCLRCILNLYFLRQLLYTYAFQRGLYIVCGHCQSEDWFDRACCRACHSWLIRLLSLQFQQFQRGQSALFTTCVQPIFSALSKLESLTVNIRERGHQRSDVLRLSCRQ